MSSDAGPALPLLPWPGMTPTEPDFIDAASADLAELALEIEEARERMAKNQGKGKGQDEGQEEDKSQEFLDEIEADVKAANVRQKLDDFLAGDQEQQGG